MELMTSWEKKGIEEGKKEGKEEGRREEKLKTARLMLKKGSEDDFILEVTACQRKS